MPTSILAAFIPIPPIPHETRQRRTSHASQTCSIFAPYLASFKTAYLPKSSATTRLTVHDVDEAHPTPTLACSNRGTAAASLRALTAGRAQGKRGKTSKRKPLPSEWGPPLLPDPSPAKAERRRSHSRSSIPVPSLTPSATSSTSSSNVATPAPNASPVSSSSSPSKAKARAHRLSQGVLPIPHGLDATWKGMDPFLAALETKARLLPTTKCSKCGTKGRGYPSCGRCGDQWCSRECRVQGGKRHVCKPTTNICKSTADITVAIPD